MKVIGWLGVALVLTTLVAGIVVAVPGIVTGASSFGRGSTVSAASSGDPPAWGSGNLCTPVVGPGPADFTCVNGLSSSPVPLWYNFSAPMGIQGGTVLVTIKGSEDCINLNFHSFYSTIVIQLLGSSYSCPTSGGQGSDPGVNVVINSEGDYVSFEQYGSNYLTNVTTYGTTTIVRDYQYASFTDTTITYIGTTPGFATCPSGITTGRVAQFYGYMTGLDDTFGTTFVNGINVAHPPPNFSHTGPIYPPDGRGLGTGDTWVDIGTTTTPAGVCSYL